MVSYSVHQTTFTLKMASSTDVQIKESPTPQEKRQLLNNKITKDDPQDTKKFVYISFYYIGLAILFPYTMLITIMDFWNYKVAS